MSARDSLHREVAVAWATPDGRLVSCNPTLLDWLDDSCPERMEQMLPGLTPARWSAWRTSGFAEVLSLELPCQGSEPIAVQVQADLEPGGLLMLSLLASCGTAWPSTPCSARCSQRSLAVTNWHP